MKRYIYLLLGIAVATQLASCDNNTEQPTPQPEPTPKPVVEFVFGTSSVETTETTATITTDTPYVTVDGERVDGEICLMWGAKGDDSGFIHKVMQCEEVGDKLIYSIEGLQPESDYEAYLQLSTEDYGTEQSESIAFTTKEHVPTYAFSIVPNITAYGLYADVQLTNISYTIDGEDIDIDSINIEWGEVGSDYDQSIRIAGSDIIDGEVSITLPSTTEERLKENTTYNLRVTVGPKSDKHSPQSDEFSFQTKDAVANAVLTTPQLTLTDSSLQIIAEEIYATLDGRYAATNVEKAILFRALGAEWDIAMSIDYGTSGLYAEIPITTLQDDTVYEVLSVIKVNGTESFESTVASIRTPKGEIPEPPLNSDTTAIAGTWHLVDWCGTTPSFEVYMEINTTGDVVLYQKMQSRDWECYTSSAGVTDDGIIRGVYDDGVAWGAAYSYTVTADSMTWTNTKDESDISVYERCELPDGIAEATSSATRSITTKRFL
ncbi:MAG: hypothetical protein IJD53_02240 [Alistipes sp.]|nr:hypothetical protein [Alistipes sp.]